MWRRNITGLLTAAVVTNHDYGGNVNKTKQRSCFVRAEEAIRRFKEQHGLPGISVGVSVNGKVKYAAGFGYANIETMTPCTDQSVMRIASISKPITASILMRLVEESKLDLHQSIHKYLPDYPDIKWKGEKVTVTAAQLLSHTSGVRHYKKEKKEDEETLDEDDKNKRTKSSLDQEVYNTKEFVNTKQALELFYKDELVSQPGSTFHYTTHGFTVLAALAEAATTVPFATQLRTLFRQLGMHCTHLDENEVVIPFRANYYRHDKHHRLLNVRQVDCSYKYAGGGILSNVHDILTFGNAMLHSYQSPNNTHGVLLKRDTVDTMWKTVPVTESRNEKNRRRVGYGLGWTVVEKENQNRIIDVPYQKWNHECFVAHTGAGVGCSSILLIRPMKCDKEVNPPIGICVAVLCNLDGINATSLALHLVDIFEDMM